MSPGSTACYAILSEGPGASAPRALLFSEDGGLSLPRVDITGLGPWFDVARLNQAFSERLGLRTTTLRCVEGDINTREAEVRVYAIEGHDPAWTPPPGARWITRPELDAAPLVAPEHRAAIASWLDEAAGLGVPQCRAPWTRPGWIARAEAFIAAELARRGLTEAAPVEQLRTWQRSCVLRVSTTGGRLFFKASPAMFGHEPAVTQLLARQFPASFPEVLAIDAREHWTLMRELDGRPLLEIADLARWADALRAFARIQVASASRVDELTRSGCPTWPQARLSERATALLGDERAMLIGTEDGLDDGEARALTALAPALQAIVEQLFEHRLPDALEHGDFRPVQIVAGGSGYAFFDLSDCAVTHPFFSAVTLLDFEEIPAQGQTAEAARTSLRDAYLEAWTGHAPMERLVAAFELARVVAILYAALYRYDIVLPHMEPKEHWQFMIPYWEKKLLHALRERTEATP